MTLSSPNQSINEKPLISTAQGYFFNSEKNLEYIRPGAYYVDWCNKAKTVFLAPLNMGENKYFPLEATSVRLDEADFQLVFF